MLRRRQGLKRREATAIPKRTPPRPLGFSSPFITQPPIGKPRKRTETSVLQDKDTPPKISKQPAGKNQGKTSEHSSLKGKGLSRKIFKPYPLSVEKELCVNFPKIDKKAPEPLLFKELLKISPPVFLSSLTFNRLRAFSQSPLI